MEDLTLVFPSSRAACFFSDALAEVAGHPVFAPKSMGIWEIMSLVSGLEVVERERLVAELYRAYPKDEAMTFDAFYTWGCQLLSDFDMLDRYMVDARKLFTNMQDLKDIETAPEEYFTEEQKAMVLRFWKSLSGDGTSELKKKFSKIWSDVAVTYGTFRERLQKQQIAYSGMASRCAAEKIAEGGCTVLDSGQWAFIGFNALSKCEQALFSYLHNAGNAHFFWDYDDYYYKNTDNEAGWFVRTSVHAYGEEKGVTHCGFLDNKIFSIEACGSSVLQCQRTVSILEQIAEKGGLDRRTAVVLADENLLLPLLHALPESLGKPNVTMGYPIRSTLAYSLLERLIDLQLSLSSKDEFYHVPAEGVLGHPYLAGEMGPCLRKILDQKLFRIPSSMFDSSTPEGRIFTAARDWKGLLDYLSDILGMVLEKECDGEDARFRSEYLSRLIVSITRHRNVMEKCGLGDVSVKVCAQMLRNAVRDLRVPFDGRPLEGFQIMGMLESRCLDFENVIILSMSDDVYPGNGSSDSSFIPYSLRKGYSIPSSEEQEAVYAYNFYSLLNRAKKVHVLYSAHADERGSGEPSRYIRQIELESGLETLHLTVGTALNLPSVQSIEIRKEAKTMEKLSAIMSAENGISPSSLFKYADCPLKFYFSAVAGLKAGDEMDEDVQNNTFGSIVHVALDRLYEKAENRTDIVSALEALKKDVEEAVLCAIDKVYFKYDGKGGHRPLSPSLSIIRDVAVSYIREKVIPYDIAHPGFRVLGTEEKLYAEFSFGNGDVKKTVKFNGTADRIDKMDDGTFRIVDYKTGRKKNAVKSIEDLYTGKDVDHRANFLNTFLYAMMYTGKGENKKRVVPALYYIPLLGNDYSPYIKIGDGEEEPRPYSEFAEEYEKWLGRMLCEIFDPSVPFGQCEEGRTCQYCDFADICMRKKKS